MDKYARDAGLWWRDAENTAEAATVLFLGNVGHWFPAAILAHHALEMLLKAALIATGDAVARNGPKDSSVWGHELPKLAGAARSKKR